ncbi:Ferrochelatase (Protoheme ferro-lyase) (Heme synthetase) [Herminiimonas arsenicoxydans]|uniref:Ferrochelatase n=1 Tax=Herminiimonas arsenicoxydans TaxID=204773 RepID=HEMH_HERAR|nr:RecName: Full=Ferrochelatase; AltName: Full=Heme synthase; AltName: Full=Protoheme ferro-lyase [Herminiimonas arsenicoxydans]CAL62772.1 Ferrochelatase (Protoheme ferro-lyase) (Heme synthetase) [Herminiimonas arsenicoxydans]
MSFHTEPPYTHGSLPKTAVLLVNLGTPDAPTTSAVRTYLNEFLSDPRVVEIPRVIWWFILKLIILPFRSGKSAKKYAAIWSNEGSPLRVHTEKQAKLLTGYLGARGHEVRVEYAMRYGSPSVPEVLRKLKADGCDRILVLPAYPQYSGTTTASIFDAVFKHYARERNVPELRFVKHYHDHESYIRALQKSVLAHWDMAGRPDKLVMSFHGVPKRTLTLGDPYFCECHKTARLLAKELDLTEDQYVVTFQSRFGKAEWLQPYTAPTLQKLAKSGVKRVDVLCPGFTSDCLETLEEIGIEVRRDFLQAGGQDFNYIACLNENDAWIKALAQIAELHMIGWPTILSPALLEERNEEARISLAEAQRLGAQQ